MRGTHLSLSSSSSRQRISRPTLARPASSSWRASRPTSSTRCPSRSSRVARAYYQRQNNLRIKWINDSVNIHGLHSHQGQSKSTSHFQADLLWCEGNRSEIHLVGWRKAKPGQDFGPGSWVAKWKMRDSAPIRADRNVDPKHFILA